MRKALIAVAVAALLGGCDIPKFTADSTSKVLIRAQPSLQMESSFEMASKALPGALKTIEGFWVVSPDNKNFLTMLTEGYCQYGSGFIDDEWEVEYLIKKNFERAAELDEHATKIFIRCMNYALKQLGKAYQEDLFGTEEQMTARLAKAGKGQRTALMWAGIGLASAINHNKDRPEMTAYLDTAKAMIRRVIELDEKYGPPRNKVHAALPHVVMGMALTGLSKQLGGDADKAREHFQKAIDLTEGKFLLPMVLDARWVEFRNNDRKAFHDKLVKILETPPSIWPEQRLANEIAHRRARRYLKLEKELFNE